jgi:peptidoglycan/LPS O-acetylase OafA/YrhL
VTSPLVRDNEFPAGAPKNPDLPSTLSPDWQRLEGVDVLRGLAILCVLMNHVHLRFALAHIHYGALLPTQVFDALVWNGQRGVQIFFAVSGFLITSTALRRWKNLSQVRVGDFYLLRFARIAPLFLLLLTVLSILHFAHVRWFVVSADTGGLVRALFAALTFHVNWLEAHRGYLPGSWDILWSLSVEEAFYLFFPLVCRIFGRSKLFFVFPGAFILLGPLARTILAHNNEVWREVSYLGGMDAIAFGCLTAILLANRSLARRNLLLLEFLGIAAMLAVLCFRIEALNRTGLDMSVLAVGTCMIIAAVAQPRPALPAIFRPIILLGQRSY